MSALKQIRQMIDGLMGTCKNGEEESQEKKLHYTNPRVCKNFLLNCCPHEILAQTRFDLGRCPKVHDVALKADFEKSRLHEYEFQVQAHEQLKVFLAESKRRSQVAKMRLAITQDVLKIEEGKKIDCIRQIDSIISDMIKSVESLGAIGNVEESLKLLEKVDALKEEKSKIVSEFKNRIPASVGQQKKLRVCEVCSSYLGLNDDDKRLTDHFNGKLHLGFLFIREKFQELENLIQERCIKAVLDNEFKSSHSYKRILIDSTCPSNLHKYPKCEHNSNQHTKPENWHMSER